MKKKIKQGEEEEEEELINEDDTATGFNCLDDNLLFEVLKHVDARSLAMALCVSKLRHKTAQDERLWELICTRHLANIGCGNQQLRSVVLALGGFRRLYSLYLRHLSKPHSSSASSSLAAWAAPKPPARWGKDEVHLSLSLLSIQYYEKMDFLQQQGIRVKVISSITAASGITAELRIPLTQKWDVGKRTVGLGCS